MALQLTHEQRAERSALKARLRVIEAPIKAERKAATKASRKAEKDRVGIRAEGQRQPRVRDLTYLAWLRRLPCLAGAVLGHGCAGPIHAAHLRMSSAKHGVRNAGMQAKPDDRHATPLCEQHHLYDQHRGSETAFWTRLGIDPFDAAGSLYEAYQAGSDGLRALNSIINSRTPA